MPNTVQKFIDEEESKLRMHKEDEKNKLLLDLGLVERLYSNDNEPSEEYPYTDDYGKYFKNVACEVSDEEYSKILKLTNKNGIKPNKTGTLLFYIAVAIYMIGFIMGFVCGTVSAVYGGFQYLIACEVWLTSFICGSLLLGFAEIIKLLHSINHKLDT